MALGMIPSIPYKSLTMGLKSGDLLLFIQMASPNLETNRGKCMRSLVAFISSYLIYHQTFSAQEIVDSVIDDVLTYMVDPEDRDDDITLVAVRVT